MLNSGDIERKRLNIAQFGAVAGSDCSGALQRALNFAESLAGYDGADVGTVIEFGPGLWYVNNIKIQKSGFRFIGAGKRATLLVNKDATAPMFMLQAQSSALSPVISDIAFENLQFRNIVDRADESEFLIRGIKAVRLYFSNVDFVSSPISSNGYRSARKCDFFKSDTFESTWANCNFWGIIGCAIDIPDGPQSDTLLFRSCIWAYCTIAGVFGLGNGSGINGLSIESSKVIGSQGGSYVSQGHDNFSSTRCASVNGKLIEVEDSTGFRAGKAILIGTGSATSQYAIVRAISGNTMTLDRPLKCKRGDLIIHGVFGFVFGHASMPSLRASQMEGCDTAIYLDGGRALTVESTSFISCARGILASADFEFLKLSACTAATIGQLKSGVSWELISIIAVSGKSNLVRVEGLHFEGSGYYRGDPSSVVANHSEHKVSISWPSQSECVVDEV